MGVLSPLGFSILYARMKAQLDVLVYFFVINEIYSKLWQKKKKKPLFFSNTPPFWNIEVGLSEIWMAKNIG